MGILGQKNPPVLQLTDLWRKLWRFSVFHISILFSALISINIIHAADRDERGGGHK
jgi:hypothetical protein